ncbi:hypothetical protein HDV06_004856 [Boothiomyces sp. JEL0866]|nr:hypothetical protein HDV06_004856 [Boothiomyces sp. JEL0866]
MEYSLLTKERILFNALKEVEIIKEFKKKFTMDMLKKQEKVKLIRDKKQRSNTKAHRRKDF